MGVRANIAANFVGQIWAVLIALVVVPINIHYLGIESYGLIGVFALLQTWLALLDMGLTAALSRELARFTGGSRGVRSMRNLLRSVEIVGCGVALAIALGVWAGSEWLATDWLRVDNLPREAVAKAFAMMGLLTSLRFIEDIYRASIIGLQRQVALNVVVVISATVRAVGGVVVLSQIAPTITAFFQWHLLVSAATVLAFAVVLYRWLPACEQSARFSVESLRSVWRFAAGTVTLTVLGFVLSSADKVILTRLLTLEEFGYYSLAFSIAGALRLLVHPVDQSTYPRLTELLTRGDNAAVAMVYHRGAQLSSVLIGTAAGFLVAFGFEALSVWTQNLDLAARTYPIVAVLSIGMMLNGLLNSPYYLQMAAGWTALLVRVNAVLAFLFVPATYWLALRFGAVGGAAAWVLINVAYIVVVVPVMHRRLLQGEMWRWLAHDVALPLTVGAAILVIFRLVMPGNLDTALLATFIGAAGLCAITGAALSAGHVRSALLQGLMRRGTFAWPA